MLHPFFSCLFHNFVTSSYFFCAFHAGTLDRNLNRFGVAPFIFSFCHFIRLKMILFFARHHSLGVDGTIIYQSMNLFCCVLLFFFPTRLAVERSHVNALHTLSLFLFRFAPLLFAPLYNLLFEYNSIQSMYSTTR